MERKFVVRCCVFVMLAVVDEILPSRLAAASACRPLMFQYNVLYIVHVHM